MNIRADQNCSKKKILMHWASDGHSTMALKRTIFWKSSLARPASTKSFPHLGSCVKVWNIFFILLVWAVTHIFHAVTRQNIIQQMHEETLTTKIVKGDGLSNSRTGWAANRLSIPVLPPPYSYSLCAAIVLSYSMGLATMVDPCLITGSKFASLWFCLRRFIVPCSAAEYTSVLFYHYLFLPNYYVP